jgi:hypothetical protein
MNLTFQKKSGLIRKKVELYKLLLSLDENLLTESDKGLKQTLSEDEHVQYSLSVMWLHYMVSTKQ